MRVCVITLAKYADQRLWETCASVGNQLFHGVRFCVVQPLNCPGFDTAKDSAGMLMPDAIRKTFPRLDFRHHRGETDDTLGDGADYVCFLAHGDVLPPFSIARMVKALDCEPSAVLAIGKLEMAGPQGCVVNQLVPEYATPLEALRHGSFAELSGSLIRKSAIDKAGWRSSGSDREYLKSVMRYGDVARVDSVTVIRLPERPPAPPAVVAPKGGEASCASCTSPSTAASA